MGIGELIRLLIYLVIGGLIVWVVVYFLNRLQVPEPFHTIIMVVVALIILLFLLRLFAPGLIIFSGAVLTT